MCIKFPFGNLNPDLYLHTLQTLNTCKVTIMLIRVRNGWLRHFLYYDYVLFILGKMIMFC